MDARSIYSGFTNRSKMSVRTPFTNRRLGSAASRTTTHSNAFKLNRSEIQPSKKQMPYPHLSSFADNLPHMNARTGKRIINPPDKTHEKAILE